VADAFYHLLLVCSSVESVCNLCGSAALLCTRVAQSRRIGANCFTGECRNATAANIHSRPELIFMLRDVFSRVVPLSVGCIIRIYIK
jgi:hypothetical protein